MSHYVPVRSSSLFASALLAIVTTLVDPPSVQAQNDSDKLGAHNIPIDAMAAALLSPAKVLDSETLQLAPTEIAEAWSIENIGVPLSHVESIRLVVATPGPGDAMFAAIVKFQGDVPANQLNPGFIGDPVRVDGHAAFEMNGPPGVVIHQAAPDSIVVASKGYLDSVLKASGDPPSGPLARYAAATNHQGHVTVLIAIEPIRPLVNGLLLSVSEQVPPPLQPLTSIPDLLDAAVLRINLDDHDDGIQVAMLAKDSDSARQLEQVLTDALAIGKQMYLSQMENQIAGEGAIPDAMRQYSQRVADKIATMLTPTRSGKVLTLTAPLDYGLTTPALLASFLAPVMQTQAFVNKHAQARNHLKQIGLAMHNHHAAHRQLPDYAIRDAEGKPLLSWRVSILPFLGEQELYAQFKLDEPWDSEHNKSLIEKIPDVFRHPEFETAPGTTVFQVPLGPKMLFPKDGPRRFREVLDGLSNTIMAIQTDAQSAVPWTKPADWEVDLDQPLEGLGVGRRNTFELLMSDGAVIALPKDTAATQMRAILTVADGEVVSLR